MDQYVTDNVITLFLETIQYHDVKEAMRKIKEQCLGQDVKHWRLVQQ